MFEIVHPKLPIFPILQAVTIHTRRTGLDRNGSDRSIRAMIITITHDNGCSQEDIRVVVKAECNRLGANLRFVVTNRWGAGIVPEAAYDDYAQRGDSENRNKELKTELRGNRLSCHRFVANDFRLMLHAAALNLLIRLRHVVADPPTLTTAEDRNGDAVPVADPTVPVEALKDAKRQRYRRYRRRKDPLGQGHIATWRTLLIKVAAEVTQSARRVLIRISTHWPHLAWFRNVCQGIDDLRRRVAVAV